MANLCGCGCGLPTTKLFRRGHYQRTVPRRHGYKQSVNNGKVVDQHIVIASAAIAKPLPVAAEVHHVDGDSRNNSRSNLVICQDRAYHRFLHVRTRILRVGGNPNTDAVCGMCGLAKSLNAFHRCASNGATGRSGMCKPCRKKRDAHHWKEMQMAR